MCRLTSWLRHVSILVLAGLLLACTNTIRVPPEPADSRNVYLVDLGRHSRLAFERPNGALLEYGYGEWRWYAKMEDQWWRAPAVLFWPTEGTLGRREWRKPNGSAHLLREYRGLTVLVLSADAKKIDRLLARLNREFGRRSDHLVRNRAYRLNFVPYHRRYSLLNNSNHVVKEWLQELGFDVSGPGIFARWKALPVPHQSAGRPPVMVTISSL